MKYIETIEDIEVEIRRAVLVMQAMPSDGPQAVKSHWPLYKHEDTHETEFNNENITTRCRPLPDEIDDMDEVFDVWLKLLNYDQRLLVYHRNSGRSWKWLVDKFKCSRSALNNRYNKSLQKIFKYVQGHQTTPKPSPIKGY